MKDPIRLFLRSSLGKKYIMALTGALLFLFVIGHMLGNLQIFLGPETINNYGHFLQSAPELLWPARLVLLFSVSLHIITAVQLTRLNRAARSVAYVTGPPVAASYASRTMMMSGVIIALFVIYHLLHFTVQWRVVNLTGQDFATFQDARGHHDIYRMMVVGYSNIWVVAVYVAAMACLCLHLSHGAGSLFQSLGLSTGRYRRLAERFASGMAVIIFVGNCSIPIAVQLGYVR